MSFNFSSCLVSFNISSLGVFFKTCSLDLIFPLTCKTISISVSSHFFGSNFGHFSFAICPLNPKIWNISSVMWGAKGFKRIKNILISSFVIEFVEYMIFKNSIIVAIAVLNFKISTSCETFLISWLIGFSISFLISPSFKNCCKFQTLCKNFLQPLIEEVDHGAAFSKSPINSSYNLNVSAPYSFITSSGLTTFWRDLLIFSPFSPNIIPWLVLFLYGSMSETTPMSYKNLCQNLEYSKWRVVCSIPPLYQSTGIQ